MSTKRPANGCNYANRRSNMGGKGKKWKEQLVQGVKERDAREALFGKLDSEAKYQKELKQKLKDEARQADIEHGFISVADVGQPREVPEWKKQKMFLAAAFPPPIICKKYKGQLVFKNKQSMQEYHRRVLEDSEWENNVTLLMTMRSEMEESEAAMSNNPDGGDVGVRPGVHGPVVERTGGDVCGDAESSENSESAGGEDRQGAQQEEDGGLSQTMHELNVN